MDLEPEGLKDEDINMDPGNLGDGSNDQGETVLRIRQQEHLGASNQGIEEICNHN